MPDFHVLFIEATPELMEEETRKKVMAAGVVLYRVTENGCWTVVSHAPDGSGYAQIGRKGKTYRLHRVAWKKPYGPIPNGHGVYQQCGNRCCVNPDHLVTGTIAEIRREAARGRRPEGGEIAATPLTPENKALIRRLAHFGASRRCITLAFGITRTAFEQVQKEGLGLS